LGRDFSCRRVPATVSLRIHPLDGPSSRDRYRLVCCRGNDGALRGDIARAGEIDFVAGPRNALDVVEVKYRNRIDLRSASGIAKAHPGRPVVIATRDELRFTDDYTLIPAHILLWALG